MSNLKDTATQQHLTKTFFQRVLNVLIVFTDVISSKSISISSKKSKQGYLSKEYPKVSPTFFWEKLSYFKQKTRAIFSSESSEVFCLCGGSNCRYINKKIDKNHFYHAFYNCCDNVPKCIVEPHIKKGYVLSHQPWSYYLKVLWIPNNEMYNVWTHLLPALYFLYLLFSFNQTVDLSHKWPLLFVLLGAFSITFLSAFAHLFHNRSSYHHCCLFIFDFYGIAMYAFTSITAHFFASAELSYYEKIGSFNLLICGAVGVLGFYCCCRSQTCKIGSNNHRNLKVLSNAFGYLYGMLPIFHRLYTRINDDPAMEYHMYQFLLFLLCPIVYASDIPQRFFPGTFDIVGHSHQLFHVFSALGCYYDIMAIHHDVTSDQWSQLSNQKYFPSLGVVTLTAIAMTLVCILIARHFSKLFKDFYSDELTGMCGCTPASLQIEKEKRQ